jgi:hypothetical protein
VVRVLLVPPWLWLLSWWRRVPGIIASGWRINDALHSLNFGTSSPEFRYVEYWYELARGQQRLVGLDADRQLHLPRRGHRGHEEHSQR